MEYGSEAAPGGAGDGAAPRVLCPQGHVNKWNHKFCGRCGSPIGIVAWPEELPDSEEPSPEARRAPKRVAIAAAAAVLVVAVAVLGYLVTRPGSDGGAAPTTPNGFTAGNATGASLIPPCTEAPAVDVESVDMSREGLRIGAVFMSRCPGGSTESWSEVRVTVADGERDIAAGVFDFSASPMEMDPGVAVRRTLVFPAGTYWRTTDMFSGVPQVVFHRGGQNESNTPASPSETLTAKGPAKPEHGSVDGVAEAVLRELRDADFGFIEGNVANRWIPQISSKKAGIVVDGKTVTSADVLRDHLSLRDRYDGTRLVWSGQWSTFSSPDWWVTVSGPPQLTATDANRWCDSSGFGVDDCFAKFVSSVFDAEGTTEYRK
ncbi:hypothetical protein ACQI4F_20065 [Mycolicibacterium vaccae]|uniref:hypothetical protein n=1 Tax=Mycolicibacterium vaccae TaxID=1810 RepID=UPI003CF59A83